MSSAAGLMLPQLLLHTYKEEGSSSISEVGLEYNLTGALYLWISRKREELASRLYILEQERKIPIPCTTWTDMLEKLEEARQLYQDTTPMYHVFHLDGFILTKMSEKTIDVLSKTNSDKCPHC